MSIEISIAIGGAILGWLGFLEKRLRDINLGFERRLTEKNEINQVVQKDIKHDIERLEEKIDLLLKLEYLRRDTNDRSN